MQSCSVQEPGGEMGRQEEGLLSPQTWQHHETAFYSSGFVMNFLVRDFVGQRCCTNCFDIWILAN